MSELIIHSLVNSGKITHDKASLFLDYLNDHKLSLEDLQVTPDYLLIAYLSQEELGLSLVDQIHLVSAIRSPTKPENSLVDSTDMSPIPGRKSPKQGSMTTSPMIHVAKAEGDAQARRKSMKDSGKKTGKNSLAGKSPRKEKLGNPTRQDKKRKILDYYEINELIGRGGFSEVRKGKNKKTGEIVAVKIIEKKQNPEKLETVQREIELMKRLNHKNIVCLKDVVEDEDGKIYMVLEYVSGGELFDEIITRGNYSESDATHVVRQIIQAVAYLHSNNIVHRDLKPENLLCSGQNNEIIKVADFGLSKEFTLTASAMETMCGTPDYVAPEVLRGTGYTNKVDIWSIGVVTYVMLCGSPPFYGVDDKEVFLKILQADYKFFSPEWDSISQEAKEFIQVLLVLDPNCRPTAQQCLHAPWIQNTACSQNVLLTDSFRGNIKTHTSRRKINNKK